MLLLQFGGLKPRIYSFLVDDSSKHKKAKDVNKNVVATWQSHDNAKIAFWIRTVWDMQWIELRVKIME